MKAPATILSIDHNHKVKIMLTPEEEKLVALVASIVVEATLKKNYEKRYQVPAVQPRGAKQ